MVVDVSSQIIVPLAMGKYLDPSREHRSQSSAHPTGGLGSTHTLKLIHFIHSFSAITVFGTRYRGIRGGRQSRDPLDERVSSLNGFLWGVKD